MAWRFPKVEVENIWSDNFTKSSLLVLLSHHILKSVIDFSPMRKPESRARRRLVKEEKLLLRPNNSMISFFSFFFLCEIFLHLIFRGETYSVYSLKTFSITICKPVCLWVLCHLKWLDQASVLQVRACAKIYKWSCSIYWSVVFYFLLYKFLLERIV